MRVRLCGKKVSATLLRNSDTTWEMFFSVNLRPSVAYSRQYDITTLLQIIACRLLRAKPLSKPILPYCQLDPKEHMSVKFIQNSKVSIQGNAIENVWVMAAILSPQCVNANPCRYAIIRLVNVYFKDLICIFTVHFYRPLCLIISSFTCSSLGCLMNMWTFRPPARWVWCPRTVINNVVFCLVKSLSLFLYCLSEIKFTTAYYKDFPSLVCVYGFGISHDHSSWGSGSSTTN